MNSLSECLSTSTSVLLLDIKAILMAHMQKKMDDGSALEKEFDI